MVGHANVFGYFLQAGLVVKIVMLLLLFASIISWTLILQRAWFFKQQKKYTDQFIMDFWDSKDLSKFYAEINGKEQMLQGLANIFHAGFKEYLRLRQQGSVLLESIQRVMQIGHAKEALQLELHLPFFASVG